MDKLILKKISVLKNAYNKLNMYMELETLDTFQEDGIVQCFEYTFELS